MEVFIESSLQMIGLDGGAAQTLFARCTNEHCVLHISLHNKVMAVNLVIPVSSTLMKSEQM